MTFDGPGETDIEQEPAAPSIEYAAPRMSEPAPKPKRADPWTIVMGVFGGALLGTGLTLGILSAAGIFEEPALPTTPTNPPPPTLTIPPPVTDRPALPGTDSTASDVAARAIPSIVAVNSSGFLGESAGSGVVYGTDGYIITNHHVVTDGDSYTVTFSDGATYQADLVGSDPLTDLAVLSVARPDLAAIDVGSSQDLAVGQIAIAVGNPLALIGGPSVTTGIVSALNRSLDVEGGTTLYGLVQTDAPITRGSSGGALLDGKARLIGITTAIAVSDVGAEGLGFAVPIDVVIGVVNDIIELGEVRHALIGISGITAFAEESGAEYPVGVLVDEVLAGGPYELGGGQINDVITAMNGDRVTNLDELLTRLRTHRAGEEMTLSVTRTGSELDLIVTLGRLQP